MQSERAYLKQPTIFEYGKHRKGVGKVSLLCALCVAWVCVALTALLLFVVQAVKRPGADKSATRYYKKIGLGFRTPQVAIDGKYVDKKCPWTGNVSIRGRILRGRVISTKMNKTIIVRRDSLHYIRKYNRYEKRHRNTAAHISPAFLVKE